MTKNQNQLDNIRKFVEQMRDLGATTVTVEDVSVTLEPRGKDYETISSSLRGMHEVAADLADEQVQEMERKRREQLLYGGS